MLGNDDPPPLARLLDAAPWGEHDEGKVIWLDDDHEMISWGFSNITPWHSYREQTEPQLAISLDRLAGQLTHPERAIVNVHVPPFDTQLDDAPVLDENLQVQQVLGQVKMAPVGSTAVCDFLTERQPLLGLHGHIHESSGIRRLGRTIAINPGQRLLDRDAQRRADHAGEGQGLGPPARARADDEPASGRGAAGDRRRNVRRARRRVRPRRAPAPRGPPRLPDRAPAPGWAEQDARALAVGGAGGARRGDPAAAGRRRGGREWQDAPEGPHPRHRADRPVPVRRAGGSRAASRSDPG